MKRRIPIVIAVLLIGSGLAAWALDLPARLGWRGAAPDALTLYGNVDIRQVELGFRVAGRLEAMNFEEGQSVKAGAILAQLDARPYDDKVAAAQAQLAVQTATLSKVEAGPRPAEIAQGRANLAERQADLANARQALERAVKLRPAGAISQAALDDAKAAAGMAVAREAAAQQALALLEEGSRPEDIAAAVISDDTAGAWRRKHGTRFDRRHVETAGDAEGTSARQQEAIAAAQAHGFLDTLDREPTAAGNNRVALDADVPGESDRPVAARVETRRDMALRLQQGEDVRERIHGFRTIAKIRRT